MIQHQILFLPNRFEWNRKPFKKGFGAIEVVYTAGYSATPKDLELALFDLVTYYLRDEHKQRQTLGGASVQNQELQV